MSEHQGPWMVRFHSPTGLTEPLLTEAGEIATFQWKAYAYEALENAEREDEATKKLHWTPAGMIPAWAKVYTVEPCERLP